VKLPGCYGPVSSSREMLSGKERCCDDRQIRSAGSYDRSYPDSPICDVVVVVRDQEMILRCRDYRQATQWARLERKTYKIPEPDTGFPANEEAGDLPLFLRSDRS
jgi:hypothetical protein